MKESDAIGKFRTVLRQFDLDEKVKIIEFCENRLVGAVGKVEAITEYRISLDQLLLTDPEKMDSDWAQIMVDYPYNVVHSLPKHDRIFLVFLHELGHIINRDCLEGSPEDDEEDHECERQAWGIAWRVYRAYRAGQEQAD